MVTNYRVIKHFDFMLFVSFVLLFFVLFVGVFFFFYFAWVGPYTIPCVIDILLGLTIVID